MPLPYLARSIIMLAMFLSFSNLAHAQYAPVQIGPKTSYSSGDIAAAVRNSPLNANLMPYSSSIGDLAYNVESRGNTGISNGYAHGILQMNDAAIRKFAGTDRTTFLNMPLQDQVNAWAGYANAVSTESGPAALIRMAQNGQTFDGRAVDGNLILACMQQGNPNCMRMINSGSCSGARDGNGLSICDMADRIGRSTSDPYGNNPGSTPDPTNPETGTGSTTPGSGKPDLAPQECWGCDGVSLIIDLASGIHGTVEAILKTEITGLMAIIFMIHVAIHLARGFFYIPSLKFAPLWWTTVKFTIVMTLITTGALYSGFVVPYLLTPSLGAGGELGTKLSQLTIETLQASTPPGSCQYRTLRSTGELTQAATTVIDLVCAVNLSINEGIAKVATVSERISSQDTSRRGLIIEGILGALSTLSMASLWFGLLAFSGQIIEALIRLTVYTASAPYVAYIWIFGNGRRRSGRSVPSNILHGFLYAAMLLAVSGTLTGIMLYVIDSGLKASGIDGATSISTGDTAMTSSILLIVYCIVTGIMAGKIIASGPNIASLFAAHSTAAATQVAGSIAAGVSTGIGAAVGAGSMIAGSGAAATGTIFRGIRDATNRKARTSINPSKPLNVRNPVP